MIVLMPNIRRMATRQRASRQEKPLTSAKGFIQIFGKARINLFHGLVPSLRRNCPGASKNEIVDIGDRPRAPVLGLRRQQPMAELEISPICMKLGRGFCLPLKMTSTSGSSAGRPIELMLLLPT